MKSLSWKNALVNLVRHWSRFSLASALAVGLASCASKTHQSQFIESHNIQPRMDASGGQIHYALPRGLVTLNIANDSKGLTIGAPGIVTVADPNARYSVLLEESGFAHDQFNFLIDNTGLLSTAKSDNLDETPKIIQKAVELFSETAKIALSGRSGRSGKPPRALPDISEELVMDPFQQPQRQSRSGASIRFRNLDNSPLPRLSPGEIAAAARQCNGSLCSRLLRPVLMTISLGNTIQREHVVLLPDPMLTVSHDVTRGACIQRVTTLTFTKGILTAFDLKKPSEVLACLSIPVEALKTLAAIPGEALTIRINQVTRNTDLTNANTASINGYLGLMEAQSKLAAAVAAATPAEPQGERASNRAGKAPPPTQLSEAEARRLNERMMDSDRFCESRHAANVTEIVSCKQNYSACFKLGNSHKECLK